MPRPQRLQYEHAFYHVMNRGRGRQAIFHSEAYYQAFLQTLAEAHQRFDAQIHAYCLMGNHYHLLIETPRANLDRIMRHINGVYTQRYNRLKHTDGALFRGRYKAIIVDEDNYLLQLSRYIHRNPAEVKGAVSDVLSTYPWSSYLAYINRAPLPRWLIREKTYQMLGQRQRYKGYQAYIEAGNDEGLLQFYNKGNLASLLGGSEFKESLAQLMQQQQLDTDKLQMLIERPMQIVLFRLWPRSVRSREPALLLDNQEGKRRIFRVSWPSIVVSTMGLCH
ncbi:transposase [Oceanicoccus sp. KOV_DT_Chl]|uniref:transposase n=1 Tax=Oceanicoccus sp. KOV_DT_Chl TaxID=1904639 RepID=UPI000C7E5D81|nr:transposase [Oceanicoccus sp. KOV_DT_Chl]